MIRTECSFCDHANPAGSKFCNGCGGPLNLASCPNCDALNDVTASVCHKCATALPWSQTASLAYASSAAQATNESYAPDLTVEHTADAARARDLEGSYLANADVIKPGYAPQRSLTPRDFAFSGSLKRSTLSDPIRPRNRILIAVLSSIGIVCMALSAYLYFFSMNKAERPHAAQNATRTPMNSGVQNWSAAPSGASERSAAPGSTNAAVPLTERLETDIASRNNNNATEPGKASSTTTPACNEVVDALGLCPPQAVQRK